MHKGGHAGKEQRGKKNIKNSSMFLFQGGKPLYLSDFTVFSKYLLLYSFWQDFAMYGRKNGALKFCAQAPILNADTNQISNLLTKNPKEESEHERAVVIISF